MLKENMLEGAKLTEEEMSDVAGGFKYPECPGTKAEEKTYIVQKGDSLIMIAKNLGVTKNDLVKWNVNRYPDIQNHLRAGWILNYYVKR